MKNRRIKNSTLRGVVFSTTSEIHGKGVFASRDIARGEYIGTYHGPTAKRNGTYVLWLYDEDKKEGGAVGRSGKNLLRYLNHADPGNAEFDGFDLYALVDIGAEEELTFNYELE